MVVMSGGEWNYADVWEAIAETIPASVAQVQGARRVTWGELDRRADGIASTLIDAGVAHGDKVANYLHNAPEYLETFFGACKIGLVPVNTNYRYGSDELAYLWNDSDAVAVAFHGSFTERVSAVRSRVPSVRLWLHVYDGSDACPEWAVPYEHAATSSKGRTRAPWGRSGDDLIFLYTGGTTGMPKGVMWRHADLYAHSNSGTPIDPVESDLDHVRRRATGGGHARAGVALMPASPLMHGTGMTMGMAGLRVAGSVVLLEGRSFDARECLDVIAKERVFGVAIVGDAFARPMLDALQTSPEAWDLSSVRLLTSAGVMWSEPVKQGLLAYLPSAQLVDGFASSEAFGMGGSVSSRKEGVRSTGQFTLGDDARVIDEHGRDVEPGSDVAGLVAVGGPQPLGYYKDPEKSAKTFRIIDGRRYSIPGDWATVDADGALRLLGRGSVCINTGGEKVFPEEVEEALKTHPAVRDVIVVGVPDERFVEAICAVVELAEPDAAPQPEPAELIAHVKGRLASFKAPRHVLIVATVGRAPNGKADYPRVRREAAAALAPRG
jgi:acyl-CoA synthetase (AMP-forming)/AMP-acid ligase II